MSVIIKCQNLNKLPQEAKDVIQAIFDDALPVSCGFPANVVEVKLDKPVHNLLYGEGTVHFHGLGMSECYLHYRGNKEWAIVSNERKHGDATRGRTILNSSPGEVSHA